MKKLKYCFLAVLVIAFLTQFIYILSTNLTMSVIQKVIVVSIQTLSVIGYTYMQMVDSNLEDKRKLMKSTNVFIFMIYLFNLIWILFFDKDFGRKSEILSQFQMINLDPFETIQLFIHGYQIGTVSLERLVINILGNTLVFMPMAYFLPFFFQRQRKWYWFILTIMFIVLSVEVLQVVMMIGTGDIDDWILNVGGAILFYSALKIAHVERIYQLMEGK